ncbi:MAG TPA: CbiX/SirB N-terminal domain-containing protein [Microthrixaceae bacterium]|nr:hypothetical protein [Microthrixaceae bacterium]HNI34613.1 CbiX/SirB N-terminal domain-containing protein [Microthrixaceae bacterium]
MTSSPATAAVVVAHGSRNEPANDAHRQLCIDLSAATGTTVVAAFLELATPSLPAAVADLAIGGAIRVAVLPYFLYPGRHIQRDIPALIDEAIAANPTVDVVLGPLFGADPAMITVLSAQLASLTAGR